MEDDLNWFEKIIVTIAAIAVPIAGGLFLVGLYLLLDALGLA